MMTGKSSNGGNWRYRLMFGVMYRLGITPWDGHPLPEELRVLAAQLPKGRALDVGCGTGEATVFLASQGWETTGVDFVDAALGRARARARVAKVTPRFVRADVTQLRSVGVTGPFELIVDQGLLHGLSNEARAGYAREINGVAAPGARMVLGAFAPGERKGPHGIGGDEIRALFGPGWKVSGGGAEMGMSSNPEDPIHLWSLERV